MEPAPLLFLLLLPEAGLSKRRQPGAQDLSPGGVRGPHFPLEGAAVLSCLCNNEQKRTSSSTLKPGVCAPPRAAREPGHHLIAARAFHARQQPEEQALAGGRLPAAPEGWPGVPALRACASCLTASCVTEGLAAVHSKPSLSLFARNKLGLMGLFSGSPVSR